MRYLVWVWGLALASVGCSYSSSGSGSDYQGETAGKDGPVGQGTYCENDDDCRGYETDFCVIIPGLGGYCSNRDCTVDPNDCPGGYVCCDYEMEHPDACLSPAKWAEYSASLCVNAPAR